MQVTNRMPQHSVSPEELTKEYKIPKPSPAPDGGAIDTSYKMQLGESVAIGWALSLHSDGKLYKADLTAPSDMIAIEAGVADELIKVAASDNEITTADVSLTPGALVWLTTAAGSADPNITTTAPAQTSNNIIQPLGRAQTATKWLINIESAVKIE